MHDGNTKIAFGAFWGGWFSDLTICLLCLIHYLLVFIIIIFTSCEFFLPALADSLSLEYHWQQVSRTRLSIVANLENTVVWMDSNRPPIFNSSSLLSKPLCTVQSVPITVGITIFHMFHSFLVLWQCPKTCLSFYFLWFWLCGPPRSQNPLYGKFSSFLLIMTRFWFLAGI